MAARTALYLRSSKDRHDVSVESQRRELRAFAEANALLVVAEFVDKVESAKTANRPAFQEMMAEVKSDSCRFSEIFCFDTSRFSRRQYDAQMYKHLLKKRGIGLRFLKLPKSDPLMDSVLESLMEVFDEFHSQKSKADGLRGMRENVAQGYRAGGPAPFGYRLQKDVIGMRDGDPITKSTLVPDPLEAPLAKEYLEARAAGEARKSIVERLQLERSNSALVYMEDNALTYAGHTVWNRHNERIDGRYVGGQRFRGASEWVTNRDTHEAIISDEVAEALIALRHGRSRKSSRQRVNEYLLSGLLKCACGAPMHGNAGYYRCRDRCGSRGIKRENVDNVVVATLLADLLTENAIQDLKRLTQEQFEHAEKHAEGSSAALCAEIADVDRDIAKLVDLLPQVQHQRGLLAKLDQLEARRETLATKLAEVEDTEPNRILDSYATVKEFLAEFREGLADPNCELRKQVISCLIDEAELDGDDLTLIPAASITGFKVALPRGLEPRFSP